MIGNQQRQTILTLYQAGCRIRKISRLVKVSRNTVRGVIRGCKAEEKSRSSRHQSVEPLVQQHFEACRHNAVRIGQVLAEQYDRPVPYSSLTRLIRQMGLREQASKRAGSYVFAPGEEMQHDTSPHMLILADKKIKAQCASLVLGFCKKIFIQYYPCFTRFEAKVFLTEAIKYMDGSCGRCVIDNTSVVIAHGSGFDAVIAPEMEAFAHIFNTRFVAHRIGDANRKAKVERNFSYIENNFLAGRVFTDWRDLNRRAVKWCERVANVKPKRSLGRLSPDHVYVQEKPHLTALPPHIPPVYMSLVRKVDLSGFVTVDTNRYSVPEALCGRTLEVLKSDASIKVFDKDRQVAEHPRLIDQKDGKRVAKGHHPPLVRNSRQRPVSKERQALTGRYPWLDQYVAGIIKRTGRTSRRKLQKLLDLQRTYPPEAFRCAVEKALRYNLYDPRRLENLILSFVAGEFFNLKPED